MDDCKDKTIEGQTQLLSPPGKWRVNDPDNPRNFTLLRRVISTVAVTLLAFVSTFGGSIYSAGINDVKNEFEISQELATLPLSLYNAGLALGPLIGAPMCETYGRKVVLLTTSPLFALFSLGAGFSQNITSLVICRFFAGVLAAPAIGNASATIIDYTAGQYRAITMAFYYSLPSFGAVFGPLVGGFVVKSKGWRWTEFTTVFLIVAFYIPVCFTKETYKKVILQRRAKALGFKEAPAEAQSVRQFVQHFITALLIRPLHMLFTEPIVTLVCTYCAFVFGLIYTFVTVSSWVYAKYYHFDLTGQSLSFLGLDVGTLFAPLPLILIDLLIYQPRLKQYNKEHTQDQFPPEHRLYPAMIGSIVLPLGLFSFAWTVRPSIHWIVPIMLQGVTMMSSIMIYAPVCLYMMDTYGPLYGASAAGAAMLSRYVLSAIFPLFSLRMYEALGVGWATTILAFCTVFMAPIPWLFWRYGEKLRARVRYETSS